jgi:hypothetical protein
MNGVEPDFQKLEKRDREKIKQLYDSEEGRDF